jgi:peptidoglycan/LPS O-acetylase OafA/YrhL
LSDRKVLQAGEVRLARIESLRALAALAVLEGHVFGYGHGWNSDYLYGTFLHRTLLGGGSGVFLFFALSGYLLFWPFVKRDYGGGDRVDLGRYALNRALRILPLYYAAIVVFLIVREHGGDFGQWWRFALLAENFSTSTLRTVDGPLWSVIVEVQFYVLLPLIAAGVAWLARRRPSRALAVLLALGALDYGFRRWAVHRDPHTAQLLLYSLPGTFVFFVPGMVVALLRLESQRRRWSAGALASPGLWLLASVPFWGLHFRDFSDWPAVVASFLVVGACVLPLRESRALRALEWRPLALLGVASYSLYVWHEPIVHGLRDATGWGYAPLLALSLAVCAPLALISYRVIEAPFLALRRRWAPAAAEQRAAEAS